MNMLIRPRKNQNLDQKGFASIVITLVLIIVLALVTIGFAQLARREQRDALNKQLASQAYFAAESGVNDAIKYLSALAVANPPEDQCLDTSNPDYPLNPVVDQTRGVSYSCVLVNMKPPNLLYDNVAAEEDRYVTFSTDPNPMSSLTISWGSADGNTTYRSGSSLPPLSEWDSPAVLEVSLTPLGTGALQRSTLAASTFTAYLYPRSSGGNTVAYNTSSQGQIVGRCGGGGTHPCSLTITGLPAGLAGQWYMLHIVDHYDPSNISITGADVAGNAVKFIDGQAQIDVTGKAREVLKRIRVRVPIHPSYGVPKYTIESQSTCKRFTLDPRTTTTFDSSLNAACVINN